MASRQKVLALAVSWYWIIAVGEVRSSVAMGEMRCRLSLSISVVQRPFTMLATPMPVHLNGGRQLHIHARFNWPVWTSLAEAVSGAATVATRDMSGAGSAEGSPTADTPAGAAVRSEADAAHQVFIANTLKCRPPRNRNPQPEELAQCAPFLHRQIALVRPKVLLAMGRFQLTLADRLPVHRGHRGRPAIPHVDQHHGRQETQCAAGGWSCTPGYKPHRGTFRHSATGHLRQEGS